MIREAIGIGETEELAKQDALNQLGLNSDSNVKFEVMKKAEKKKFGIFGGSPAKVKAIYEMSDDLLSDNVQQELNSSASENVIENNNIDKEEISVAYNEEGQVAEEADVVNIPNDYAPAVEAKKYIENVLSAMGLESITVEIKEEETSAEITLSGDQVGAVIGRRGETLDALQYLAGLVANHVGNSYYRITINTGNYREKREKTLEVLGRKLAFKVLKTGKNVSLEPMNPYERRIIHTSVQKVNGAISWSEGEVTNRHVVIGPDPEYKRPYRKNNYNNRNNRRNYNNNYDRKKTYNNRNNSNFNRNDNVANQDEREPKNEGGSLSLYGKVDTKSE